MSVGKAFDCHSSYLLRFVHLTVHQHCILFVTLKQQQKPIPQHSLINAHFAPVATTTTIPATAAPASIASATSAATNKQTSISDIVAASGLPPVATPTLTAVATIVGNNTSANGTNVSSNTKGERHGYNPPGAIAAVVPDRALPKLCRLIQAAQQTGISTLVDRFLQSYPEVSRRQTEIRINEVAVKEKRPEDKYIVWHLRDEYEKFVHMTPEEAVAAASVPHSALSTGSSVRTGGSVNTASVSQRGGEEGITFLHSNAPVHSTSSATVTVTTTTANLSKEPAPAVPTTANSATKANGASYSTQNTVRSVATGKGQPSFGSVTKTSPTTSVTTSATTAATTSATPITTAATTAASSVGKSTPTAVPSTTAGQSASQPSKRKAEDGNPVFRSVLSESAAANATGTANGNNLHKKMRSNSEDMAIIAPPPKVIEIIEID